MEITCKGDVSIRLTDTHAILALARALDRVDLSTLTPDVKPEPTGPTARRRVTHGTCPRHGPWRLAETYDVEKGAWVADLDD